MIEVDWDGLRARLAEILDEGFGDLEFEVRALGKGARGARIMAQVQHALAVAHEAAVARVPQDPTSTTSGDAAGAAVVVAINNGLFFEDEIQTWFETLVAALDPSDLDLRIGPRVIRPQVPRYEESWGQQLAATGGVAYFRLPVGWRQPSGWPHPFLLPDEETYQAIVDPLVDWARIHGGVTGLRLGLTERVVSVAEARRSMHENHMDQELQVSVAGYDRAPDRMRLVELNGESGVLVVTDEDADPSARVAHLINGLREIGPHLDVAAVMMMPRAQVRYGLLSSRTWPAPPRLGEDGRFNPRDHWHLMSQWTPDAYLAQVLTGHHLDKEPVLDHFDVEPLANDRYLVVARDLAPWISDIEPDPDTLARARRDFAPMLLTPETIKAHPRPGPPPQQPQARP